MRILSAVTDTLRCTHIGYSVMGEPSPPIRACIPQPASTISEISLGVPEQLYTQGRMQAR